MLQLKQTTLSVSLKKNDKTIWADKKGKQYLYLNCYQIFVGNHKQFKNAFESIKLFGDADKLNELLKRLEENAIVKIETYYCELYLMQYQDKNVKPFASSNDWNFDKNKFKPTKTALNRPKPPEPLVAKNATADTEAVEQVEEVELLGDGIELP